MTQFQFTTQLTPVVKKLLIANVAIYVLALVILQQYILGSPLIVEYFGLSPGAFVSDFFLWQVVTYMFLHHPTDVFHVLFNMLMLWWVGSELESHWGPKFFALYYFVCGVGAGLIYTFVMLAYFYITGDAMAYLRPVIGASGAIFGLFLAYGIIFGDRVIYFMMMLPMKARYFVMILGAVEVITLLNSGTRGGVANLAHLGGILAGYLFLLFVARRKGKGRKERRGGRRLKLVVDNERDFGGDGRPRYWN